MIHNGEMKIANFGFCKSKNDLNDDTPCKNNYKRYLYSNLAIRFMILLLFYSN